MPGCKAPEILRNEGYSDVCRNKPAPCLTRGRMTGAVATNKEQLLARPQDGERAGTHRRWAFFSSLPEIFLEPIHAEIYSALAMGRVCQAVVGALNHVNLFERAEIMKNLPGLVYGNEFVFFPMNDKAV